MSMKEKVRFWFYWNRGYVRLSIRKGQTIKISRYHLTDEGSDYLGVFFRFDGETLEQESTSSSHDCDGPLNSGYELKCGVDRLDVMPTDCPDIHRPDWQIVESYRRDLFAEAMGY